MNMYDPTNVGGGFGGSIDPAKEQSFVTRVFNWMFMGLGLTALVAFFVSSNPFIMNAIFGNMIIPIVLMLGTFGLVWNLSANFHKMSAGAATMNFFVYAALNGVMLSTIMLVYTASSITSAFLVSSITFAAMAFYGATTKKDLSGLGSLCFMGLIGLVIAQLVNMFLHNTGFDMILSYLGVLIFVGLTAYDMQKIKQIGQSSGYHPNMAIMGALRLYLDFINLFLYILRIMGRRR